MLHVQPQHYSILQKNEVPDGDLVRQALAGDQHAFESLFNRYHHQLMRYIDGILKDHDQSYDVLQQVYLQLYLSLPIISTNLTLKPWLFQVARYRSLDELRRRRRRQDVHFSSLEREDEGEGISPLEAIPDSEPLPEELTENTELQGLLQTAMDCLPPKVRSIVLLHCFRQLTFSEIGRTLNMPTTTVKTSYHRSLPRLRKALEGNGQWALLA